MYFSDFSGSICVRGNFIPFPDGKLGIFPKWFCYKYPRALAQALYIASPKRIARLNICENIGNIRGCNTFAPFCKKIKIFTEVLKRSSEKIYAVSQGLPVKRNTTDGASTRGFFSDLFCVWGMFYTPKVLTWNLKTMVSKGISFSRGWFSGSMLNFRGVWLYPKPQESLKIEGFHHTTFHDSKILAILCALIGLVKWPFKRLLVTSNSRGSKGHGLNHLDDDSSRCFFLCFMAWKLSIEPRSKKPGLTVHEILFV